MKYIRVPSVLLWFFVFSIIPFFIILFISLSQNVYDQNISQNFSLDSYVRIFDSTTLSIIFKSLINSLIVALLLMIFGYLFADSLNRIGKWKKIFLVLAFIPFLVNTLLKLYSIVFIFRDNGLFNEFVSAIELTNQNFLYNKTSTFFVFLYVYFPLMVFPIYSSISLYNNNNSRIANDIGYTKIEYFFKIKLPILRNGFYNGFTLVFLLSLGDFLIPQVIGGGKELYISNLIFNDFTVIRNWSGGSALAIFVILLAFFSLILLRELSERLLFKQNG